MNLGKNWVLKIDPGVYKDLSKIPKDYARKILEAIENLPVNPYYGDTEKIKGERHLWRKRIGRYRLFYEIHPRWKRCQVPFLGRHGFFILLSRPNFLTALFTHCSDPYGLLLLMAYR